MTTYKYIFTRYNEDISWILNDDDIRENSIIYNKGSDTLNISNEIITENVGKDAGGHLKYIIDNYNNLPDICIFSQSRISDHVLYGEYATADSLRKLRDDAIMYGESPYRDDLSSNMPWMKDWNLQPIDGHTQWLKDPSLYKNNNIISFIDWFNIYVDSKSTNIKRFHPCCIFSVSKEKILSRSKEYYINLFNEINWHWNGIEIGFMERSWHHIFNPLYVEYDE